MKTSTFPMFVEGLPKTASMYDVQEKLVQRLLGAEDLRFFGSREKLVKLKQNCLESAVKLIKANRNLLPHAAQKESLTYQFLSDVHTKVFAGKQVMGLNYDYVQIGHSPLNVSSFVQNTSKRDLNKTASDLDLRLLYFLMEGEDLGVYLDTTEYVDLLVSGSRIWM